MTGRVFERVEPPGASRRSFLAAIAGAGIVATGCTGETADDANPRSDVERDGSSADTAAPAASVGALVPFRSAHQAGIVAPFSAAGVVAGLDVRVNDRAELIALFQTISAEIEQVMDGQAFERRPGGFPPLDTGILGPEPGQTRTAVIVGFGSSLFDDRFGLAAQRPDELVEMPRFGNDGSVEPRRSDGDISIVVQADTHDAAHHALRQVLRRTRGELAVRWLREGYNTLDHAAPPGTAPTRNLMGFKDGTANPDRADGAAMDCHVWIQPDDGQPAWTVGGTFQAIRVIRMMVEFWDRTRLSEQEGLFGRHRDSGAPLGLARETDVPRFGGDFESHIARANPRTPGSERNVILRRPFSYVGGTDDNSQLDQGLIFTCYQRSLTDGFLTVQRRLDGEALEEYIRPLGGGLYVVPPGPSNSYLGAGLLET